MILDFVTKYVKISYEISAIFFDLVAISFMHMKIWEKGEKTTKVFRYMAYCILLWTLNEVINPVVMDKIPDAGLGRYFCLLVDSLQFFWGDVALFFFIIYLENYTDFKSIKWVRQLYIMIIVVATAVIFINPITGWLFTYYGLDEGYEKGPLYGIVGYFPAILFGATALYLYVTYFKQLLMRERVGLLSTILMIFAGATIQPALNGRLKITGLFASYGLFILYLALETSDYLGRMSAKAKLEEAQEIAASANKAKSTFIANMSHEIRTPMNAILGINDLILKDSKEEKIISYAKDMKRSGDSLLTIINDVLDISKIEAGKMEIQNRSYHLSELVDELVYDAQKKAKAKRLEFHVSVDENLPNYLVGDKEHLGQVVRNVLDNAIKFTRRGYVRFEVNGGIRGDLLHLVFMVADSGIGIKEEDLEKVFTNFGRVDMERNRSIEGTGLGLSLCQKIMTLLDGSITVNSEYGVGSTFTIELDQYIEEFESIQKFRREYGRFNPMTQKFKSAEKKKFLVVDDNEMNLKVAEAFLESSGAEIITENDSVVAFSMLQKEKYDLVILDDLMPRLTGPTILTRVRRGNGMNKETPFIIMTANSTETDKKGYLEKGFDGFVGKPIKEEKLIEAVNNFIVS